VIADSDANFRLKHGPPWWMDNFRAPVFGGYDDLAAEKLQVPKAATGVCT